MRFLYDIANMGFIHIVVFGSFFMGIYYFSFFDNGKKEEAAIEQLRQEINQTEEGIKKKKVALKDILEFKSIIEKEKETVDHFLSYIPNEQTAVDVFQFLTSEAKSTGVNINDKKDEGVETLDIYDALKVNLTVSGAFSQVLLFLSRLTAQKRILVVKQINMNIPSSTNQWIEASMTIYAYRYKGEAKDEEKEVTDEKKAG